MNNGKSKKRGNKLGFAIFKFTLKFGGLHAAYGLLYFVCLHYLIFDFEAVKGALAYLNRRFPKSNFLVKRFYVFKLFVSQGKQLIDRFAAISGLVNFEFCINGKSQLNKISSSKKGVVLLTAHVGNWQIAITTLKKIGKNVCLVMLEENNQAVKNTLNICGANDYVKIINSDGHLGGVVQIIKELNNGNIVAFMGDRPYGSETYDVDFLGQKANFPYGAFLVAAAAKVPVMTLLVSKIDYKNYLIDVPNLINVNYEEKRNKREQLKKYVQNYAHILTKFVKQYPFQCFLFYDIWV